VRRRWPWALAVLSLGVALGLGFGERLAHRAAAPRHFPVVSGELDVAGIGAPVDVDRDGRGIPHVSAASAADAWVALGVVHAQDRLAQMAWMRRIARGRTAEIVGEVGLPADRLARTLGIGRLADAQVRRLDDDTRAVLDAYVNGVNQVIDRVRAGRVPPPLTLGEPAASLEPWRPSDSIALLKWLSWSLGPSIETIMLFDDMLQRLGSVAAGPFFPGGPGFGNSAGHLETVARIAAGEAAPAAPLADLEGRWWGGSAWVMSGRRTATGAPILGADLQLTPTAPPLVYEAQLRGGALDVAGATVPGIPAVLAGRNPGVGWAAVPALAVTTDLFEETVRRSDGRLLYQNGSEWVPFEEREERIAVRGAAGGESVVSFAVRSSRHGPIINDLLPADAKPRPPLALSWTGAQPGDGLGSLLAIARAERSDELLSALERHHEPVLAFVYADAEGRAGMKVAGWLPRRPLPSRLTPVPGRLRGFDWRQPVPFAALPSARVGRGSRWVIAADNPLAERFEAQAVEWLWRTGERAERLDRLLAEAADASTLDLHGAAALQADAFANLAPALVPAILALAGEPAQLSAEAQEVAARLGAWDGAMTVDSRGASVYRVLLGHLLRALFAEHLGEDLLDRYLALPHVRPDSLVKRALVEALEADRAGGWIDRDRVRHAVRQSLHRTWLTLTHRLGPNRERWRWGRLHEIVFRGFASLGPDTGPAPGLRPLAIDGGDASVAAASSRAHRAFAVESASVYRVVIDLASPDRMLTSLAPGQSEHLYHRHYADGLERWLEGRPSLLVMSRFLVEEETVERLVLDPAS